ncbi:sensor histidine kinase [Marinobacter nauticus]|uniref:histidine kinase n=1 Tax=Marinobacter nauticus TaxID=2743 RepID=A0A368ULR3_MARNT|nr:sensor histidine kinase KdpD [Marinobacter nauticus]RBP68503.1 two-component system sensor histidine kinase KdpD [Marinobacter nauticus]RCW29706.1 two-component system sensor histidine kinase KdpD [Marinobacter nauticus]
MTQGEPNRPNPDALLKTQERDSAGGLKIFLGAAPGVGKTYQMLQAAHELKRQGVDVVVGVAETHGRADTLALCEGLEQLPAKKVEYAGKQFREFDVDAALKRKPDVLLVDELAHRNIPGTRHPRRYQDIEELLDQGITVWTAINIQHLESLSDVVASITGVRMRETVPDSVLERARDIVLVDLTPSELLERLRQGKVYVPEQAREALDGYFSPSNLSALRELAVQAIAERLDSDVRETMQSRGIEGPWHIRSRMLVAVEGSGQGETLVRAARRLAERRKAPWTVVTVDNGRAGSDERQRLGKVFDLATRLGAEVRTLRGYDVAGEILAFAREQNVTTLILGRSHNRWWHLRKSTSRALLKDAEAFEVTFIPVPRKQRRRGVERFGKRSYWKDYTWAFISVVAATVISAGFDKFLPLGNLSLIYLTSVLWVASRTGIRPALFTAALSFLTYNFFFTVPRMSFQIAETDVLLTVVFFLIIAVIGGNLAGRLRDQVQMLRGSNDLAEAHLQFTRRLASAPDITTVRIEAVEAIYAQLRIPLVIFQPSSENGDLEIVTRGGPAQPLDDKAYSAIDWTMRNGKPCGAFSDTLNRLPWRFEPIEVEGEVYGVLGLRVDDMTPERYRGLAINVYVHQLGLAWFRTRLAANLSESRVAEETERLRSALLSSISHDLRTPLSSMIGSASTLKSMFDRLSDEDRDSLLDSVLGEGERLDRYIRNLLDMTKLGHGTLKIDRDWIAFTDILSSALRRTRNMMSKVRVERDVEEDLPLLFVHPALIEQALVNVLENAAKFAPDNSTLSICAHRKENELVIAISDEGPGIPEDQRSQVFDMFFTGGEGDRGPHGSGLGLAICHGMVAAHGGRIQALAGPNGIGATIEIALPLIESPEQESNREASE